jgi:hypothetical protein
LQQVPWPIPEQACPADAQPPVDPPLEELAEEVDELDEDEAALVLVVVGPPDALPLVEPLEPAPVGPPASMYPL